MNSLIQQLNLLIGDVKAMEELEKKDKCKILLVSDSHGQHYRLLDIVSKFGSDCDAMIFCGDGCGDMIYLLEEAVCDCKYAENLPPVIALAEGNNDCDSYAFASDSKSVARIKCPLRNTLKACGHTIYFTHGHRSSLFYGSSELIEEAKIDKASIVIFGHTHVAFSELTSNRIFLINPGSISLPRSGQPATFATVSLKKGSSFADCTFYQITAKGYSPYIPKGFW